MAKSKYKILIPKEHGAWAILLIPYSIGVAIADGFSPRTILGLIGILLLFISRPSLIALLKRRNISSSYVLLWLNFLIPATLGLSIYSLLFVRYGLWKLLHIGLVGLVLFFLYIWLTSQRKEHTIFGELVGIFMLTLSSPIAIYLAKGQLTIQAFMLWLVNTLYFAASIFYIKMKVRASIHRNDLASKRIKFTLAKNCIAYLIILILIITILTIEDWIPLLVPLAFVPMITHTLWNIITLKPKLKIMKEGWIQTGLALIFLVLVIISYKI